MSVVLTPTPDNTPPGTPVVLTRNTSYGAWLGAEGVATDWQTKRVATIQWTTGEHAGSFQTVRSDRFVAHPVG